MRANRLHRPLTAAYLEFLHDEGISLFSTKEPVQRHTCLDLNLLESAPLNPFATYDGVDLIPDIVDKATCLFMHTAGGHVFDNGNKRLGVLAVDQFLLLNGIYLFLKPDQMQVLAERTADRSILGLSYDQMSAEVSAAFRLSAPFRCFDPPIRKCTG